MSKEFGKVLRLHRKAQNLTQTQLLDKLKNEFDCEILSKGTISKWEHGKNTPKEDIVEALEGVLYLPRGTLLGTAGYHVEAPVEKAPPVDTIIVKRKEKHFEDLAAIAKEVLLGEHNLIDTEKNPSFGKPLTGPIATKRRLVDKNEYIIIYCGGSGLGVTREDLSSALREDMSSPETMYSGWEFSCLVSHLEAENPDIKSKGFGSVVDTKPYELIETLRLLSQRGTFKGTCLVCQDWK